MLRLFLYIKKITSRPKVIGKRVKVDVAVYKQLSWTFVDYFYTHPPDNPSVAF